MVSEKQNQSRFSGSVEKGRKGVLVVFSILKDILTNSSRCNNNQNHLTVHKETPLSKKHLFQLLYICKLRPRFLFFNCFLIIFIEMLIVCC